MRSTQHKVERFGAPLMRQVEREIVLRTLDQHWREHLAAMDYLRQGIHLRGYAQKDYRYEFKREAFQLFSLMLDRVKHDAASMLSKVEVRTRPRSSARRPSSANGSCARCRPSMPKPVGADRRGERASWLATATRLRPKRSARRRLSCATTARSAAMSRARAAPARSSSSATEPSTVRVVASLHSASSPQPIDAQGRVLIAQRPAGSWQAGRWEFPGGKVEPDESDEAAVRRELREELGVQVQDLRRLPRCAHDYARSQRGDRPVAGPALPGRSRGTGWPGAALGSRGRPCAMPTCWRPICR